MAISDQNKSTNTPFFSICTEATNRESTIRRTIESIARQTCRDFEYIIVNNQSDDQSDAVIKEALRDFAFSDVVIKYHTTDEKLSDIKSWNAPLMYAEGKYIVVCEGDDWFTPDHLEKAAQILVKHENIGLYISGRADLDEKVNYEKYKVIQKRVPAKSLMISLLDFAFAPPPSEAIFLRMGRSGPFLYNADIYVYAAEYGLYTDILSQGFDGYINSTARTVFRGRSVYMRRLFHVRDAYTILEQWRGRYINRCAYLRARHKLLERSATILAAQIVGASVEWQLLKHVFKEAVFLRTLMPLWRLLKCVMVSIRERAGAIRARLR